MTEFNGQKTTQRTHACSAEVGYIQRIFLLMEENVFNPLFLADGVIMDDNGKPEGFVLNCEGIDEAFRIMQEAKKGQEQK